MPIFLGGTDTETEVKERSKRKVNVSKKQILLLVAVILVLMIALFMPRAKRFMDIDKCLDRGSRWNYEKNICESLKGRVKVSPLSSPSGL
jgi:hypothetical protein